MALSQLCPFCAEPIREEAFRCPHCHAWLVPWSFRHKGVPGVIGLGVGAFFLYEVARENPLTDLPTWLLIALASVCILYGLYHLFRSTRRAFEEGRKELLERYRKPVAEREED
jgi:hypothetical protein